MSQEEMSARMNEGPYPCYSGPDLISATLADDNVTDRVQAIYGSSKNWDNRFWKYSDFLTDQDVGKGLSLEFRRRDGRVDWMRQTIPQDLSMICNGPIWTPFCDCGNPNTCRSLCR